ncbi:uncharacterized protein METZ01_LOCUS293570, partial [marine metagenome]
MEFTSINLSRYSLIFLSFVEFESIDCSKQSSSLIKESFFLSVIFFFLIFKIDILSINSPREIGVLIIIFIFCYR